MVPDRVERLPVLLDAITPTQTPRPGHVPGRGAGYRQKISACDEVCMCSTASAAHRIKRKVATTLTEGTKTRIAARRPPNANLLLNARFFLAHISHRMA